MICSPSSELLREDLMRGATENKQVFFCLKANISIKLGNTSFDLITYVAK